MIRVLLVEDDKDDFILTKDVLIKIFGQDVEIVWEPDWAKSLDLLCRGKFDICLLDYFLGARNGVDLVMEAARLHAQTPIILLTGRGNREIDLSAMQAGAADFLDKSCLNPTLLERSIRYAIREFASTRKTKQLPATAYPRVLMIEDDEDDFILAREMLHEVYGPDFELDWACNWQQALDALDRDVHDIYLVDYRLGARNGIDLVAEAQAQGCTAPIILLTGQGNREVDLEAMKAGAADYLVKNEISGPLLDRAIRYAIERRRGEQRLTELAQFDQLTGLANRSRFHEYLSRSLDRACELRRPVAVLLLDLDRFKIVNDTYGHDVGDQLLVCIADRLKQCVRSSDLVARLGGDEFTVVIDGISDPTILSHFADRILAAVKQPIRIGGTDLSVDASIGIAVYPTDGDTLRELVRSADTSMYRAKEDGAGQFRFYTVAMQRASLHQRELEKGLRDALDQNQFEVWYQPQMDVATGRICGVEALLRWIHPEKGIISPGDFITLAEETGLIVPIGEWVFNAVCEKGRELKALGLEDIRFAVNFSARQFQEKNLLASVTDMVSRSGIEPQLLEIELTENCILKDPSRASEILQDFSTLGFNLALDDFGTGYSSLMHLQNFPGGTIKIDRSFVSNIAINSDDAAIVRAIISMAHNMQLKVVAEGVETHDQLDFLSGLNCDTVQGYLFCKPMSGEDISSVFQSMKTIEGQTTHDLISLTNDWQSKFRKKSGSE